jgi:ABC-type transporter Mla subunit MlaD
VARVPALVDTVDGVVARVPAVVTAVEGLVETVAETVDRVPPLVDTVESVADDVTGLVGRSDEIRAAIAAVLDGLAPLLEGAQKLSPTVPAALEETLTTLPATLARLESDVVPAVQALEGLVPTIENLARQVDELQVVVGDVGSMLGGIPGAARLRKRSTP